MADYLNREEFLNMSHESLLTKRERLLKQEERELEGRRQIQLNLQNHWQVAKKRNKALLEDIKHSQSVFRERIERPYSSDLVTLKEQYWAMVERELPGWKAEVKSARGDTLSPRPR